MQEKIDKKISNERFFHPDFMNISTPSKQCAATLRASPVASTETVMATIDVTKTAILTGIHHENGPLH